MPDVVVGVLPVEHVVVGVLPVKHRDAFIWPGAVTQDGAFVLPTSLPGHESAKVLIETIFGKGYPLVLPATALQAVLRRRQSIGGVG
jgi:hypothetical protein